MRRIVFSLFVFLCALTAEAQPTNLNLGTAGNNGTGMDLRTSLGILNANDTYLYNLINGLSVGGGADKVPTNNGTAYGLSIGDGTPRRGMFLDVNKHITPDTTVIYAKLYCVADGATDDTAAMVTAISAVPSGGILDLGGATYSASAVSISKSNFKMRNGTIKFAATNGTGVVITGNDWVLDGVNVDGNSKSVGGFFVNNGSKRWEIKNSLIQNIYGDDVAGSATVAGIFGRRGCQFGTISDCVFTNISHATNGTRVSRAISLTDFGYSGTNDQVLDITIKGCKFYNIAAGAEGDCVALNLQRSYSSRVIVSDCQGYNFGHRFGKVEGGGTVWHGNYAETYSQNGGTNSLAYSGFSFYGPSNICNGNLIVGNLSLGIEFGSYSSTFEAYYGQANGNMVIFTTASALTNGVGIDFTQKAYDLQADGNIVYGGRYAARMQGDIRNCQFGLTLATNQVTAGIVIQSDGTNAPSGCDIGNLKIEAPAASYGFNVSAGTNINVGFAHGTVASSLYNRAVGVTGSRAVESDTANATAGKLMQFDNQLRAINAVTGVGVTNTGGAISINLAAGANITLTTGANGQQTIASTGGGASDNWTASGTTNSTLAGVQSSYSGVFTNSLTVGNGTTAGFEAWLDGGTHYFSISPPTLSTSVNLIPDTAPGGGFWFGTVGSTTNETITHVGSSGSGNVVRASTTITAGAGLSGGGDFTANRTLTLDQSTFVNNVTMWDASQATRTWTANLSGATDPVWTYGNNSADLSTGVLEYGGNTVATSANNLGFFSATTSAQLLGNISDETGSATGSPLLVFNQGPTIDSPIFTTNTRLPNGASVTTGSVGMLGFDTDVLAASHGAWQYTDGSLTELLVGIDAASTFTDAFVVSWDGTAKKFKLVAQSGGGGGTSVYLGSTSISNPSFQTDQFANNATTNIVIKSAATVTNMVNSGIVTLTDAATVATDASLGPVFKVTFAGNRTLGNPTNGKDGQRCVWKIKQDGTGSRTITMDTKFRFGTDITGITLTTTASKTDILTAIYDVTDDKWDVVGFVRGY